MMYDLTLECFKVSEDDLPDYLEVVAAKREVLAPGLETGANGEGTEEENVELPADLDVVAAKRQELSPGSESGANSEGTEEENAELPADLDVVAARGYGKRQVIAPGSETGANGEGTEEENSDLPESLDIVSAKKRQELAPGLENGANDEGTEEENESLPESLDVVAAKRAQDTLVDGYVLHKNQMTNPPDMVKRDENHDGSFNVGDLVDLDALEQQVASKFTNDPNDEKTEGDIPGQALNPEDFYQADMVKEIAMDFKEDPILLARLWEGDIANVLPDDLQQMMGKGEPQNRNAIR